MGTLCWLEHAYIDFVFFAEHYLRTISNVNEAQVYPTCSYVYSIDFQCLEPIRQCRLV